MLGPALGVVAFCALVLLAMRLGLLIDVCADVLATGRSVSEWLADNWMGE